MINCRADDMFNRVVANTRRLADIFKDVRCDDSVYLDLDDTILLTALNKYGSDSLLTESDLAHEIQRLINAGVKVYGLTARWHKFKAQTLAQLAAHGIVLMDVIHAPSIFVNGVEVVQKGRVFKEHLAAQTIQPRRIFVFDDLKAQLEDIAAQSKDITQPIYLYCYSCPQRLDLSFANSLPEHLNGYCIAQVLVQDNQKLVQLTNPNQPTLLFSIDSNTEKQKIKILQHALYRAWNVNAPEFDVFTRLPQVLAKQLGFDSEHGEFYVMTQVEDASGKVDTGCSQMSLRRDFVMQALLDKLDVNSALQDEWNELMDLESEQTTTALFGDLSEDEIKKQIILILDKIAIFERVIWDVSSRLKMRDVMREQLIQLFGERIDILVQRFQVAGQAGAKRDKKVEVPYTAAGILTYTMMHSDIYVLLSERNDHLGWGNLGGKSEYDDGLLITTALREVREESSGLLNYAEDDIWECPFHDFITDDRLYRMYIAEHPPIPLDQLTDREHTAHEWVPLRLLLLAVANNKKSVMVAENKQLNIYLPLFHLLQQPPVYQNLKRLCRTEKLKQIRTRGYQNMIAGMMRKRVLVTPQVKRNETSEMLLNYSSMLREMRNRNKAPRVVSTQVARVSSLSPSEIHMKVLLGDQYAAQSMTINVLSMVERYFLKKIPGSSNAIFLAKLSRLIQNEINLADHHVCLYHSCSGMIAAVYKLQQKLYERLSADQRQVTFRAKWSSFKAFPSMLEVMAHYSDNGRKTINNNDPGYNDLVLATNVFLAGNHQSDTSCSLRYFANNTVRREINVRALLLDLLQTFDVPFELVDEAANLCEEMSDASGGYLYQIAVPKNEVKSLVYPASINGSHYPYQGQSDNLVTILELLKNAAMGEIDAQTKEYVTHLQARLLVSPQHPLSVVEISMNQLSEEAAADYEVRLEAVVRRILFHVLGNLSVVNQDQFYPGLTLFKFQSTLLRANQLAIRQEMTINDLANAIINEQADDVIRILRMHPHFKYQLITHPKPPYFKDSRKENSADYEPMSLANFMIRHARFHYSTIITCLGLNWWQGPDISLENAEHLAMLISMIPRAPRLAVVIANIDLINNAWDANTVSKQITRIHRYAFIKHISHLFDNSNTSMIVNTAKGKHLLHIARLMQYKVRDGFGLYTIFRSVERKYRTEIAINQKERIGTCGELALILGELPVPERLDFVYLCMRLIKNSDDLIKILNVLLLSERLELTLLHLDKMQTMIKVAAVATCLSDEDRETLMQEVRGFRNGWLGMRKSN